MKCKHIVLSILGLIVSFFCFVAPAQATTYYVRTDGGTATQCTGLADAKYSGSGSGQACAFNHPFWAISVIGNNTTRLKGGDTLIIDGTNGAQYMMGWGAPNVTDTSICYSAYPWDCYMRAIPSGPSPTQPTRILGKGWDTGCAAPPQLWGTERTNMVLNLQGSNNVEVQCLEVTDHSACQDGGPNNCNRNSAPYGPWAIKGLVGSDSSNVLIKNVNIHGMAHHGIHAARIRDWTIEDSKIVANSFVGWDGDMGANTSSDSGTITFNRVTVAYSGCGETYPGKVPYNCYSQSQGGYGDGLGMSWTGGDWVFNNCDVSHNVSDGIDLLYHNGSGNVTIKRTRAEGNAGNQIKSSAKTTTIENSIVIGNCSYFKNNSMTYSPSTFDNCRAQGNALSMNFRAGQSVSLSNSTFVSNGDSIVMSTGQGCTGGEKVTSRNNVFLGRQDFLGGDNASLYYAAGATGNGDGACGAIPFDDDYSIIYGTKGIATDCNSRPHSKCVDPKLTEPLVNLFTGNAYNAYLQSASPARNEGIVLTGKSNLDYNNFDRGTTWDAGALEFGSLPQNQATCATAAQYCTTQADCILQGYSWNNNTCGATSTTNAPPIISLTSPTGLLTLTAPASLNLAASASDPDGTIAKVDFYNGTTLLTTVTTPPYTYTWKNVPVGVYAITAKATDDKGAVATASGVNITISALPVNIPPLVTLTSPPNNAVLSPGPVVVNILADVFDADGTIAKVEFFNGTAQLSGVATAAPYGYTWKNVLPGTYSLTAKATDDKGAVTISAPVTFTVTGGISNVPPSVSLTSPTNNASFGSSASINLSAKATDSNGSISKVEFFSGTKLLGSDSAAPYSLTWSNVSSGTYTLIAKATDNTGAVATSTPVKITVNRSRRS